MKKLLFLMLPLLMSATIMAYDESQDGLNYELDEGTKTAEVVGAYELTTEGGIVIPEFVEFKGVKYRVVAIRGLNSINNLDNLVSVSIPNSVTSIGASTFFGCKYLTTINIPNGVKSIGNSAFGNCKSLSNLEIPNSVTFVGAGAFNGTGWLDNQPDGLIYTGKVAYKYKGTMPDNTEISLMDGCTGIANEAFNGCKTLVSVEIPGSVTYVGGNAFKECTGLQAIELPDGLASVGNAAFSGCTKLASIVVPNSVVEIGNDAFLKTAWYNAQPNGLVYAGRVAYVYKGTMPDNTEIVLKDDCPYISPWAFNKCSGLVSITIPESVSGIGDVAFQATGLKSISLPNSIIYLGSNVFNNCTSLATVELPNTIDMILSSTFSRCSSLVSITIPSSCTVVGDYAFKDCVSLESVILPEGLESIEYEAFSGCTNLSSIDFPASLKKVDSFAFSGCSSLTSIFIPKDLNLLYSSSFSNCQKLNSIVVAEENTVYDSRGNCNAIIITSSNELLAGCMNTVIPMGVRTILVYAFSGCTGLTSINIPNSVTKIEDAFDGCTGLTSIHIPGSVTQISRLGRNAFMGCTALTEITVSEDNPKYDSRNNCNAIIETETNKLVTGCINTIIPSNITTIGRSAFKGLSALKSLIIPSTLTTIESDGLTGCTGLEVIKVEEGNTVFDSREDCNALIVTDANKIQLGCKNTVIPNTVTTIGFSAFEGCKDLTSIDIPEGVSTIENTAFRESGLTMVNIPTTIKSIGAQTFARCENLMDVFCYAEEVPQTQIYAFENSPLSEATLHVPAASISAYKSTNPWRMFGTIVAIEDDAVGIKDVEEYMNTCAVYNLQGRKLNSLNEMKHGLYIVNGKKIVK